jgi:hypothetical protein
MIITDQILIMNKEIIYMEDKQIIIKWLISKEI